MKTTKAISEKLEQAITEVNRLNKFLQENELSYSEKYKFSNGEIHPEWNNKQALMYWVSVKNALKWVLS